jgi:transcriptional regulator with XRE-family HTH domain
MGFRENLKDELAYNGMLVKELSAKTGINKYTIDNYLSSHNCSPSAGAAVKIAAVLGVSVEYLVTGSESRRETTMAHFSPNLRRFIRALESLREGDRKIVLENALNLIEVLKKHPASGQGGDSVGTPVTGTVAASTPIATTTYPSGVQKISGQGITGQWSKKDIS